MKIFKVSVALVVGLVSTYANAATVFWEPTNADANFSYSTVAGYDLGLFDVDDFDNLRANALMLNVDASVDTISITATTSGNFTATSSVTNNSITLFNDNQFVLAITDGIDWFEPLFWFEVAPNSNIYDITFSNGSVLSIDATPTVVPVPAAVWLFGSGLLGLVGIARRKKV